jgi:hypothetical protein
MKTKVEFFAEAQKRLDGLSGLAYETEWTRIDREMQDLVREHFTASQRAKCESLEDSYVDARREHEAREIMKKVAKPGAETLLLPHVINRIAIERNGDEWTVSARSSTGAVTTLEVLAKELAEAPELALLTRGATPEERAAHARKVAETLGESSVLH